jgi:hypothetical protein
VSTKRWRRLGRGIYQAQTGELSWLGRAHAAVLRGGEGCALSLRSAEYLHGVAAKPPPVITIAVPRGRRIRRLTGTRFRACPVVEVVTRKGLPVTSATQTVLLDGCSCARPPQTNSRTRWKGAPGILTA